MKRVHVWCEYEKFERVHVWCEMKSVIRQALGRFQRQLACVDTARLDIEYLEKPFVGQRVVALDIHPVDDRILDHGHSQHRSVERDVNVTEEFGFEQPFQRYAERSARYSVACPDRQI